MMVGRNVGKFMDSHGSKLAKVLVIGSTAAAVLLTTPAWIPGFCAAAVICVLLCAVQWKLLPEKDMIPMLSDPWCGFCGLVIVAAYGVNFYNMWLDSSYVLRLARMLSLDVEVLVTGAAVLVAAAAVPCVVFAVTWAVTGMRADFRAAKAENSHMDVKGTISAGKAFWILCAVYFLGISAILRADFLYQDDAGRAAFGYKQWDYFGRFLSTAMATIVHGGDYLTDVAPLPQLLAMAIMAGASVLILYIVYDRTEFFLWEVLSTVCLGLNPYFLECVSFRFDAPYMAVSVLGAVLPLLLRRRNTGVYLVVSAVGVLSVCTSYQAATGIFPMLVILLALRMWNRGACIKDTALFCIKSAAGYCMGLVYFKLVLMRPVDAGYVSNALPSVSELLPNTLENLAQYYSLVLTDFKPLWLIVLGFLAAGFLVVSVCTSHRRRGPAALMSLLALVLMLLLCFGIYPVLRDTLFAPRAMYGFGMFVTAMGVVTAEGRKRIPSKLPVLALSWMFFVFAFTYGNALNYQREYTDYRIELVLDDLNDMEVFCSGQPVTLQISGSIGQSPIIDNMPQNYQMLNRLVPETFSGADDLTQYRFFEYYDLRNVITDMEPLPDGDALPLIRDTMYHTITADESRVVIYLK